jgi:DNA-binding transcriptional LysR family regulator
MEVNQLRYFVALSRTLNFTAAAEQCNVSQPSLTRAIRVLESSLGAGDLVNRERGNIQLTELGRMLLPYIEQSLAAIETAKSTANAFRRNEHDSLRIGLMCTIGPERMGDFFRDFTSHHPQVRIYLKDSTADGLESILANGELDVAIYCRPEKLSHRFHHLALYQERFVLAIPKTHDLAAAAEVPFSRLHGERYLHRANCEYNDHIDRILEDRGIVPNFPYESERDDWIQAMVAAGLGITAIPQFAVTNTDIVVKPLVDPELFRTIQLVTVRGRRHNPALGRFVVEAKRFAWKTAGPS